jgi:hypothetical protein
MMKVVLLSELRAQPVGGRKARVVIKCGCKGTAKDGNNKVYTKKLLQPWCILLLYRVFYLHLPP